MAPTNPRLPRPGGRSFSFRRELFSPVSVYILPLFSPFFADQFAYPSFYSRLSLCHHLFSLRGILPSVETALARVEVRQDPLECYVRFRLLFFRAPDTPQQRSVLVLVD
jgi:hypothetical protein